MKTKNLIHPISNLLRAFALCGLGLIFVHLTRQAPAEVFRPGAWTFTTLGNGSNALSSAEYIAVDDEGNVYVASTRANTINRIAADGKITLLAGRPGTHGNTDGVGTNAQFFHPHGLALDGAGNLYCADSCNCTIRRITKQGAVTTVAGWPGDRGTDDGTGSEARFFVPCGIAVDNTGNLFVTDTRNNTIRKVQPDGKVMTFAGQPGIEGSADGSGREAQFCIPTGIAIDGAGNLYVADMGNHAIRKVSAGGRVTTVAGRPGSSGSADGRSGAARFCMPAGIDIDAGGVLYVADSLNNTIRRISADEMVETVAGIAGENGSADGPARFTRFALPLNVRVDKSGCIYVADAGNGVVRKGVPSVTANVPARPVSKDPALLSLY